MDHTLPGKGLLRSRASQRGLFLCRVSIFSPGNQRVPGHTLPYQNSTPNHQSSRTDLSTRHKYEALYVAGHAKREWPSTIHPEMLGPEQTICGQAESPAGDISFRLSE